MQPDQPTGTTRTIASRVNQLCSQKYQQPKIQHLSNLQWFAELMHRAGQISQTTGLEPTDPYQLSRDLLDLAALTSSWRKTIHPDYAADQPDSDKRNQFVQWTILHSIERDTQTYYDQTTRTINQQQLNPLNLRHPLEWNTMLALKIGDIAANMTNSPTQYQSPVTGRISRPNLSQNLQQITTCATLWLKVIMETNDPDRPD